MSYAEAAEAIWETPRFHSLSEHARLAILYRLTARSFGGWRQAAAVAVGSPAGPMLRACLDELEQAFGDKPPATVKALVARLGADMPAPGEDVPIPEPFCDTPAFVDRWKRWLSYRRKIRHDPVGEGEARKIFAQFRLYGVDAAILAMIDSESHHWKSVFPERHARRNGNGNGKPQQDRFDMPTLNRRGRERGNGSGKTGHV